MKKRNKGTTIYIIGIITYVLLSIISILASIQLFDQADRTYSMEQPLYLMAGGIAIVTFIALTLWFLSFTVGYIQRKTQIELLQEMSAKKE